MPTQPTGAVRIHYTKIKPIDLGAYDCRLDFAINPDLPKIVSGGDIMGKWVICDKKKK